MNKQRRKQLESIQRQLDDVNDKVQGLAAEDASLGEGDRAKPEYKEQHEKRVKGWQNTLSDARDELDTVRDEEAEAAENVAGEERKGIFSANVDKLGEAYDALDELVNMNESSDFTDAWEHRYETISSCIEEGQE